MYHYYPINNQEYTNQAINYNNNLPPLNTYQNPYTQVYLSPNSQYLNHYSYMYQNNPYHQGQNQQ